jgi:hypothetical protein
LDSIARVLTCDIDEGREFKATTAQVLSALRSRRLRLWNRSGRVTLEHERRSVWSGRLEDVTHSARAVLSLSDGTKVALKPSEVLDLQSE